MPNPSDQAEGNEDVEANFDHDLAVVDIRLNIRDENLETSLDHDPTVDDDDISVTGGTAGHWDTTSIATVFKGYIDNGRRFQSLSSKEYCMPTDEEQWESHSAGHIMMLILDHKQPNPLFRSPISADAKHIIDIGTGSGEWAYDAADRNPTVLVQGVDLYPPPQPWIARNCIFEADDVSGPWRWSHKFDLVHIRQLLGAFSHQEWDELYGRIYENVEPGGWIEQVELDIEVYCIDDSLPADSVLRWGKMLNEISEAANRPMDVAERMESRMAAAGFENIQTQNYKIPIGPWPKLQVHKDAGKALKECFLYGLEGWTMWLLTKHGQPAPWSVEQHAEWMKKARDDVEAGYHIYQKYKRVWAQKPRTATGEKG